MHVIQRGNNRSRVFGNSRDRSAYLNAMFKSAALSKCAVHAYVLMTNHVHILLTPGDAESAARMMRRLGAVYVRRFNEGHQRTGTLWEDRFRSIIIESDRYFFECSRYIELNPVRAGMVNHPADHPWSSYSANALGQADSRLCPHPLYQGLGGSGAARCREYRALFAVAISADSLELLRGKGVAGSDEFCANVLAASPKHVRSFAHGGDRRSQEFRRDSGR